jgi:TonB family protein
MLVLALAFACSGAPEAPAPAAPEPVAARPAPPPADPGGEAPAGRIGGAPILDRLVVLGALDTPAVEAALDAGKGRTDACYREADGSHPSRMGKVLVRFIIGPDGAVTKSETRASSLRHAATEACLTEAVAALPFPAPPNGGTAIVMAPFSFPPG